MKISLAIFCVLFGTAALAQTDYSGSYGYSGKVPDGAPKEGKNTGPTGSLVLLKMDNNNKYRFWLDINKGWPSYNNGATDGTLILVNDTASFDNSYEGSSRSCLLHFTVSKNKVSILSGATGFDCDFGHGVHADGEYLRLKTQPLLDDAWLKSQYTQTPTAVITASKAELFQDDKGLVPFSPRRFFEKGNTVLSIAETEKTMYTEYIPSPGKFIYGWIKRTDLKILPSDK